MRLSEFIKAYREEHHISQREFARRTGLSSGYISMLENEYNPATKAKIVPSLSSLMKIASVVNVSIDDLLVQLDDMIVTIDEPEYETKSDAPTLNIVARGAKNMPMPSEDLKRRYFEYTFGDQLKEKEKESTLPDGLTEDNIDDVFMQILVQNRNKEQILEFAKKLIEKAIEL